MSFSRWQKLMAARMLKAVRPAAPRLLTAGAGADSLKRALPEDRRGAPPGCTAPHEARPRPESLEPLSEAQSYHPRRVDIGQGFQPADGFAAAAEDGALGEAVQLDTLVEQVVDEQLGVELAARQSRGALDYPVGRLLADQRGGGRREIGIARALVDVGTLQVHIATAERESVARSHISLELGHRRQLRARGHRVPRRAGRQRERRAGRRVGVETEVLAHFRIELGGRDAEGEARGDRPLDLLLGSLDARGARVADDGKGVLTEEAELEVLPILPEERAVHTQVVVEPGGLEPQLVVLEEVRVVRGQRRIRWSLRATIDAARPEALRHGRVHHVVRIELVGQVEFGRRAVLLDLVGQVDTRAAEDAGLQAPGTIGVTGAIGLEGGC